eukprot:363215-Chlamydomonas_euryale.AAC.1
MLHNYRPLPFAWAASRLSWAPVAAWHGDGGELGVQRYNACMTVQAKSVCARWRGAQACAHESPFPSPIRHPLTYPSLTFKHPRTLRGHAKRKHSARSRPLWDERGSCVRW